MVAESFGRGATGIIARIVTTPTGKGVDQSLHVRPATPVDLGRAV